MYNAAPAAEGTRMVRLERLRFVQNERRILDEDIWAGLCSARRASGVRQRANISVLLC